MTGKDLIIYILQNNLENEVILKDGILLGMMTEEEASAKFKVGPATIEAWFASGFLPGVKIGKNIFFLRNASNPMEERICE